MSTSPSPKLTKVTGSTASKVQTTSNRLSALVPTLTTTLSPSTVYQPGIGSNYLTEQANQSPSFSVANAVGVWTAPQVNGTAPYEVQVECFGGGGGGGGGSTSVGGGGGGGGEYACEPAYTVVPGKSYVWIVGACGTCGMPNQVSEQPGSFGTLSMFDVAGVNLPGGVIANGGQGGDVGQPGSGGNGGTGSGNTIHYDGGSGGLNQSGVGSDNPAVLMNSNSYWAGGVAPAEGPSAWWILDDNTTGTNQLNSADPSGGARNATVTSYTGGLGTGAPPGNITGAPTEVPTSNAVASAVAPGGTGFLINPTIAGACVKFNLGSLTAPSAKIQAPTFPFAGSSLTVSAWVKCDPTGTWGNNINGACAMIATNCNYSVGTRTAGFALFWSNVGTPANPNWAVNFYVGTGTAPGLVYYTVGAATPANWVHIVATFNAGAVALYVNGATSGTSTGTAGFTSVGGGQYATTLGVNPANNSSWFFGYMSNVWMTEYGVLNATGIGVAGGSVAAATGGSGGGSTGSPGGTGLTGAPPVLAAGGAGASPAAVPSNLTNVRTAGSSGANGAAANTSNETASPNYGGGGGGAGDNTAPAGSTLQIPFAAAASYCGTDSGAAAGSIYNPNQQTTAGVLFAGGASSDAASGSKNSLLLIPSGTFSGFQTGSSQSKSATQILLTVRNANPSNTITSIVKIGYAYDTSLPANYTAADLVSYVGYLAIPSGAEWVTIDLTQSYLMQGIAGTYGSVPAAVILGPGTTPTYDAYNAISGNAFYSQIYGPGATDGAGNSLQPYLTLVYADGTGTLVNETAPVTLGSFGGPGKLLVSLVDDINVPVGGLQPYATTDTNGNEFAAGYTGQALAFHPGTSPATVETWQTMNLGYTWEQYSGGVPCSYRMLPDRSVEIRGQMKITSTTGDNVVFFQLPSAYWPANGGFFFLQNANGTGTNFGQYSATGQLSCQGAALSTSGNYIFSGKIPLD